jgi:hypothetical protein
MEPEKIDEIAARLREYVNALDGMEDKKLSVEQVKSIMAAEKIFASGQDVDKFKPEDIEDFTTPTTVHSNAMASGAIPTPSGAQYPAAGIGGTPIGGVSGKPSPFVGIKNFFKNNAISRGLVNKYGLHRFEIEQAFDKDCLNFCCITQHGNRLHAAVDRHIIEMQPGQSGYSIAVAMALAQIEHYLSQHPGV